MDSLLASVCIFLSLVVIGPSLSVITVLAYGYHLSRGTRLFPSEGAQFPRVLLIVLLLNTPYQVMFMIHSRFPLNEWIGHFIWFLFRGILCFVDYIF